MYLCVGKLQNMYFNMKDSEHFSKYNFSFLYQRQSRVLFIHLLLFGDTLLCKPGSGGLLGPQKLSHFYLSNMHFPTFPGTFSSKIDVNLCRYIHKISFSI